MKKLITLIFFFFSVSLLCAQKIAGRIVNITNQIPVEAATVTGADNNAVQTDKEGYFSIILHNENTITISHIGFAIKTIIIEQGVTVLLIKLDPAGFSLTPVTVNATSEKLMNQIAKIDLNRRPFNNSQEILRMVPGLFVAQHAGGGKAEQLFLRGFDVDHGTDVHISVDGLPVNMVSHAHGQGYADLHFVIPETVDNLDFGKGLYYSDKGDLNTAGYVALNTKNYLANNMLRVEGGMFNTLRTVAMFNMLPKSDKQNAFVAAEFYRTDGPFISSQDFNRINLFAKHHYQFKHSTVTTEISTFWSKWYASGQVPMRAIESGQISWFGAIDDKEGGQTSRTNISTKLTTRLKKGTIENQLYYSNYNFELYSNFTFFKEDSVNGDEIRQKEHRNIFGYNGTYTISRSLKNNASLIMKTGINIRHDIIDNLELSRTYKRTIVTDPLSYGDAVQTNIGAYISATYKLKKWTVNMALRGDDFIFRYRDILNGVADKSVNKAIVCPKLNVMYQASTQTNVYIKMGKGFHSNDTRVVVKNSGTDILPAAYGADIGFISKINNKLIINTALWVLYLQQEFVYVGDEAVIEPSGKTFRKGMDISLRYQATKFLFADIDANYTIARATQELKGKQYIPLAPVFTTTGGLTYQGNKIDIGIRYRCLGDRAANEDRSVIAKGYFIADANAAYHFNKKLSVGLIAENVFNSKWKETQFLTESRLQNEPAPIEEIHFTPGTPFFLKARVTIEF